MRVRCAAIGSELFFLVFKSHTCSLMTHLTPAALTSVSSAMTTAATARSIRGEWSGASRPAIDSPKPVAHRALPMACEEMNVLTLERLRENPLLGHLSNDVNESDGGPAAGAEHVGDEEVDTSRPAQ